METKLRGLLPEDDPRRYYSAKDKHAMAVSTEQPADASRERLQHERYPAMNVDALEGVISQLESGIRRSGRSSKES